MRLTALFTLVVLASCGPNAAPCTTCPPVDGVYAVTWGGDAGVLAVDGGTCSTPGSRVSTWTLGQSGTRVTTTIEDVNLGGTIYDTYDLVLSGSSSALSYRLRSVVIPEGTSMDAGIRLQGTFTTRTLPTSGEPCEVDESFTAQRTSR
ncbi:MAG: hypothetical protein Q8N23_07325 [Archangium sp.]|nr:hypothetical protein [Archangium sp.]MDP3152465.1 hypothetical protein [Archangium sp.]MDP3572365.1 hypothetical protein [Archangium sp.]